MKTNFFVFCSNQMIDDMRTGGVAPRIAKPLAASVDVTADDAGRVVDSAILAGVFGQVTFGEVMGIIFGGVVEGEVSHGGS